MMSGEENGISQIYTGRNRSELIQEAGQTFEFKILDPNKALELQELYWRISQNALV